MLSQRAIHQFRFFGFLILVSLATSSITRADIFRWDNGLLIPGTEGITPGPGVQLDHHELAYASLHDLDLTGSRFDFSNLSSAWLSDSTLTNANLSGADLANAYLVASTLMNADLTGAVVTGAAFSVTTSHGFSKEQLYSTASYQAKNLKGIGLGASCSLDGCGPGNDLSGWDFSGQNLANAILNISTLTNANLSGADLTNANLLGSTLTNANLSGANLANADLGDSTLTNAYLSGAVVTGADFGGGTTYYGFTKEQLYSTASYQAKNLTGIKLWNNDLSGWDFHGQNLANVNLEFSTLTDANLSGANLANAYLGSSTLTNANLNGAVVTGADFGGTTGFTKEQLYSTASYQAKNLAGIGLGGDLRMWPVITSRFHPGSGMAR